MPKIVSLLIALSFSFFSLKALATCESDMAVPGPWDSVRNQRLITLLIDNGIDFRPGDKVFVVGPRYQSDFILAVAAELRRRGAADVQTYTGFDREEVRQALIAGQDIDQFVEDRLPAHFLEGIARDRFSSISIDGSNVIGVPEGVKSEDWTKFSRAIGKTYAPYTHLAMSGEVPWTIIELPTPLQASLVAPELPPEEALATLKKMVADVYWLDETNISERWVQSSEAIEARGEKMNSLRIKKLHYKSAETDLTLELHQNARWQGGRIKKNGRMTQPNFPTFENYATPLKLATNGIVKVQRPVPVMNTLVRGAWFKFSEGKVIDYGATNGKEALDRFFAQDPNNSYLGEVALVDASSPVNQQPRPFYSIVFDENALSHIALGAGYPTTFVDPIPATPKDYEAVGMNSPETLGHTDFMIGSPDLDITAETYDGRFIAIMRKGNLVFE